MNSGTFGFKPLTLVFLIMFVASALPAGADDHSQMEPPGREDHFEWLIMVYVAGDNDLGEDGEWGNAAVMDLDEMESSIPEDGVRVLALTDLMGPSNSVLYDIRPDDSEGLNSPSIPLSDLEPTWSNELNMADHYTLEMFMEYSITNTSFDRSMFVMWDHGSGWLMDGDVSRPPSTRGFAQDHYPDRSYMYLDDMRDAFVDVESTIGHFDIDIIGFDTCYMGMVEIFYQFADWAHIGVGSMDEQPWYGYNYTFISSLEGSGPHYPEDLAEEMITLFKTEYESSVDTYHTAVAADIGILKEDFMASMEPLSRSLYSRMYYLEEENNGMFHNVVGRSESIGIDTVDVGSFLQELIRWNIDENVTELARTSLNHYNRTIIDSWIKPMGRNPRGTGLTIYLPTRDMPYKTQYDGSYGFLNMTADHSWDEMIGEYQDPVERIRMSLSVVETGSAGTGYGIIVNVTDVRMDPPVQFQGIDVWINDNLEGVTGVDGTYLHDDVLPGLYHIEARSKDLIDIGKIKALNRPPVPVISPTPLEFGEGQLTTIFGNLSWDPDGDLLTYAWDIDDSNGLEDIDSTDPSVQISFDDDGDRIIRLTVNDSETESYLDMNVSVINLPPIPFLASPISVHQDEIFTMNGSDSYDSPGDEGSLQFRYSIDSKIERDWDPTPSFTTSIGDHGTSEIMMEVRDKDGGISNQTMTITVLNREPVSVITGSPALFEDEIGSYSANMSTDTPSDIDNLFFRWFIDGSDEPSGYDEIFNVSFKEKGSHFIELEVHDDVPGSPHSLSNRSRLDIYVENMAPVAIIEGPDSGIESVAIKLNASSSVDTESDLPGLEITWDTDGDGDYESEGAEIFLTFYSPGKKLISLKVMDDDGSISVTDQYVDISNLPPEPSFTLPEKADEDEAVNITIDGIWDTSNDLINLTVTWFLDGKPVSTGLEPGIVTIDRSGEHSILVEVIDDQDEKGIFEKMINITNPVPHVILSGVPTEIGVGEEFTAEGFRSYDNPSDMASITFTWYLDGEELDIETWNATFTFDTPGVRTIGLEVRDDDGDGSLAELAVSVEDDPLLVRALDMLFSAVGMIVLIVMLILIITLVYRVNRKMKELNPPETSVDEENNVSLDTDIDEEDDDDMEEDHSPDEEDDDDIEDPDDDVDEVLLSLRMKEMGLKEGDIEPPDLGPPELPGPPEIEGADLPEPDGNLFDMDW